MTTETRDCIEVKASPEQVYRVTAEFEKWHEFIPAYRPCTVRRDGEALLVDGHAVDGSGEMKWTSRVRHDKPRAMSFEQTKGQLKGMRVEWTFDALPGGAGTRVTVMHRFSLPIPLIGGIAERRIAKPRIDALTRAVLEGVRARAESVTATTATASAADAS